MFVLVGCKCGKWLIYDTQTRDLVGSHVDGNETIETMRFSPDGTMLALGSRDNNIYIYQVSEDGTKYSKVGRCSVRYNLFNLIFYIQKIRMKLIYTEKHTRRNEIYL